MGNLSGLINIDERLEKLLEQAGVIEPAQLKEMGSMAAWIAIRQFDSEAGYDDMCALEAANQGISVSEMDEDVCKYIKKIVESMK